MTLVLGISVLLRIDFQLQDNISSIQQAKSNARIGLQIALGELQQALGPDEGTIVPADKNGVISGKEDNIQDLYSYSIEDLTLSAYWQSALGVLSNAAKGGLKKDISAYLMSGAESDNNPIIKGSFLDRKYSPKWGIVRSFYNTCRLSGDNAIKPVPIDKDELAWRDFEGVPDSDAELSITHGVGPVIIGCTFGIRPEIKLDEHNNYTREIKLKYFVTLGLWNPYDIPLSITEYCFDIRSRAVDDTVVYLNESAVNNKESMLSANACCFKGGIISGFKRGEVKYFSISPEERFLNIEKGNLLVEGSAQSNHVEIDAINPLHDSMRSESRGSYPRRGGRQKHSPQGVPEPPEAKAQRNDSIIHYAKWGKRRNPVFSLILLSKEDPNFYFQEIKELKIEQRAIVENPDLKSPSNKTPLFALVFKNRVTEESLKTYNPRIIRIWPTDANRALDGEENKDPASPYQMYFFVDGKGSSYSETLQQREFTKEFLPFKIAKVRDFHSLGVLRHINFAPTEFSPAFAFGNSFKNYYISDESCAENHIGKNPNYLYDLSYKLNEVLWDEYFLSGYGGSMEADFEKKFLKLSSSSKAPLLDIENCAETMLLKEVFNINSTSREAWGKLLSALQGKPYFLEKFQIDQLTEEIVSQIKQRGPFNSLASFINRNPKSLMHSKSGVIQAAIDRLGINITQGEILAVFGDKIAIRSDSFIIRACGGRRHLGEAVSCACCEALVQRVPEFIEADKNLPHDKSEDLSKLNRQFGRRFKIISFRWLNSEVDQPKFKFLID